MSGFIAELRRRKVVRVAVAYAIVAWLLIQVAETTFEPLRLPDWAVTLVVILAILGFPLALVLAWIFEITPAGVRVDAEAGKADEGDEEHTGLAEAVASADPVASGPSVAVLPFADLSPEQDQAYFCRGLAEEISGVLAGIPGLRVASRMAARQFRQEGAELAEIGRRLDVSTVVEGSVRKAGERLRVTAQLVGAGDGFRIWGDRYDVELSDVFAIQERIAASIAEAFQLTSDPGSEARARVQGTRDIEAYDYYLQGMSFLDRVSVPNFGFARDMFRKAVERDPEFTRAWAGLAIAVFMIHVWADDSDETRREADEASRRALGLCNESAMAQLARGLALFMQEELEEAARHLRRATEIEPGLFDAWYYSGRVAMQRGETREAIRLMQQAAAVRPTDYQPALLLPQLYRDLEDPESAERWAREGLERAMRHLELHPDDYRAMYLAAGALVNLGKGAEGRAMLERALDLGSEETGLLYNAACFFARVGDLDQAIDYLERCPIGRLPSREWMENDADLEPLRGHPRFIDLLRRSDPGHSVTSD